MFQTFSVMRQLHDLLGYVTEALQLASARPVHLELRQALSRVDDLTWRDAESLLKLDLTALHGEVNALLLRASELARHDLPGRKKNLRGAQLIGSKLAGTKLRGASLRGACLVGADLTRADLRGADLIGTDLRGADLSGADLSGSIFLTQAQVNAAIGDTTTQLPAGLTHPVHWRPPAGPPPPQSPGSSRRERRRA